MHIYHICECMNTHLPLVPPSKRVSGPIIPQSAGGPFPLVTERVVSVKMCENPTRLLWSSGSNGHSIGHVMPKVCGVSGGPMLYSNLLTRLSAPWPGLLNCSRIETKLIHVYKRPYLHYCLQPRSIPFNWLRWFCEVVHLYRARNCTYEIATQHVWKQHWPFQKNYYLVELVRS